MNRTIKNAALQTLRSAGVFSIASHILRKNNLLILCYHGISMRDEHEWEPGLFMPPARFREALRWLRDARASVLPLTEAVQRLHAGTLPPRSVAITFDDGFVDFHKFAFPLLREFAFPATLYLTTYYSHFRLPIFNLVLDYVLWKGGVTGPDRTSELKSQLDRAAAENEDAEGKDAMARALAESLGVDYESILRERLFQIMTPEEAAATAVGGIEIELHTHRHRTPIDRELFTREIKDNAREIAAITGKLPRHFCYPSGVTAAEFLPWLRECGVETATTCVHGLARQSSEPLLLPRFLDGCGVGKLDFERWLCGLP
jgi:peptidoglycan/xylan/chitin deacetylase (PgdA/CDA1 family)